MMPIITGFIAADQGCCKESGCLWYRWRYDPGASFEGWTCTCDVCVLGVLLVYWGCCGCMGMLWVYLEYVVGVLMGVLKVAVGVLEVCCGYGCTGSFLWVYWLGVLCGCTGTD